MKKTAQRCGFFFLTLLLSTALPAQSVTINTSNTSFTVNSASGIETTSTIASSFTVSVNSRSRSYDLYIGTTATSFLPSTTDFPSIPFSAKLRSITGVGTTGGATGALPLIEYPPSFSILANDATATTAYKTAVWTYDLIMAPIGYAIPPGTYTFTVTVQYFDGINVINKSFNIALLVQPVLNINLVQNASTSISFNTSGQYTDGVAYSGFTTHNVKSNLPWLVNVASQSAYFTPASSGADNNMPCSVIGIKPSIASTFMPLSVSNKVVKTGNAGNSSATGNSYNVDVQINPGYTYNAGIYNLGLTYTLTAQ